jgi:fructosamine-3-kinase|tara:strand:+ start:63 stop:296 length:234 start_codon:yes stop_codon:yes gene_type:complete
MWKLTKQYFKDMWRHLWSKTTVDEKAIATLKEAKRRFNLTAQEVSDIVEAVKEVGNQLGDIDDALKGKARKGRKSKN